MKLTKGKISKLYKKNKQSLRRKKGGKGKTGRNRTFRKNKGLNLANKSLKHFYNKYGGQAAVDPNAPAPAGESPTVLASSDPTATGESPTVLASSDPTATGESPTVLASSDPTATGESPTVLASSDPTVPADPNAPPADPNAPPVADPAAPDPPGVVIDSTDPNPAGQSPGEVIDPNAATDASATSADASAAAPSSDTSAAPSSDTTAAPSSDTTAAPSSDTSAAPSPDASIVPGSPTVDTTDNFASAPAPAPASGDNSASPASSGNMNQISNNSTSNDKITISGDPNQIVTLVSQLEKNGSQQGGVDPFSPNVSYAQAEGNSGLNLFSGTGGKSRKFKTTRKRRAKKSNKKTKCKK